MEEDYDEDPGLEYSAYDDERGVKMGRKPKLTPHQMREAIKRRDKDGETVREIARMSLTARFHG